MLRYSTDAPSVRPAAPDADGGVEGADVSLGFARGSTEKTMATEHKKKERTVLRKCPDCAAKGKDSDVLLVRFRDKETGEEKEFAGCEVKRPECGWSCATINGRLPTADCPECGSGDTIGIRRKNGLQQFKCPACGKWSVADESFAVVPPPECPECGKKMHHTTRKGKEGAYFWKCGECDIYSDSDMHGKVNEKK
jgi:predicted RNA-binding Zn-ribbon protein involved in translation (DUF1610 family)